jgi:hypothetical protein
MARLEFFVVSESLSVDQVTNRLSVFDVLEVIGSTGFPITLHHCAAVSLWRKEPGDENVDFQVVLRITTGTGEKNEIHTNFRMTRDRHRVIQRIQGIPIPKEGELHFEIFLNGEHSAEHVVTVEKVEPVDVAAVQKINPQEPANQ